MKDELFDIFIDSLKDALQDTLWVMLFLFLTYFFMELAEHKLKDKSQEILKKAGFAGPVFGSFLGVIPQCGFSSAASALFSVRAISLGTLLAVYLSTSDEMIPIFIAGGIPIVEICKILILKIVIGMFFGFLINFILFWFKNSKFLKKINNYQVKPQNTHSHSDFNMLNVLRSSLKHTIEISIYVFLITFILNLTFNLLPQEYIESLFSENKIVSVFITSLIGLIPNCVASVTISKLYISGLIGLGACISGLLTSAGIGLLVLFKTNRPKSYNLFIVILLYVISTISGFVIYMM